MQNVQVTVQISNQGSSQQVRRVNTPQNSSPGRISVQRDTPNQKQPSISSNSISSLQFPGGYRSQFNNSQGPSVNAPHQQQQLLLQAAIESYQITPTINPKHFSSSSVQHQRVASANSANSRQGTFSKKQISEHHNRASSARAHSVLGPHSIFSDPHLVPQAFAERPKFEARISKDSSESRKKLKAEAYKLQESVHKETDNQIVEQKLIQKKTKFKDKPEKDKTVNGGRDRKDPPRRGNTETNLTPTPRLRQPSEHDKDNSHDREMSKDFNRHNQLFREELRKLEGKTV